MFFVANSTVMLLLKLLGSQNDPLVWWLLLDILNCLYWLQMRIIDGIIVKLQVNITDISILVKGFLFVFIQIYQGKT